MGEKIYKCNISYFQFSCLALYLHPNDGVDEEKKAD